MGNEERPLPDAHEGLSQSNDTPTLVRGENTIKESSARQSGTPPFFMIAGVILVIGLIVAGLFLRPISLGQRLSGRSASATATPAVVAEAIPSNALSIAGAITLSLSNSASGVQVGQVSQSDFFRAGGDGAWTAAAAAIPTHLIAKSDLYTVASADGSARGSAAIMIPAGAEPHQTLDLYGWDGRSWHFLANSLDSNNQRIVSAEGPLPQAFILMQMAAPPLPAVAAELLPTQSLPSAILPHLTEVIAGTLTLGPNGQLMGEAVTVPTGPYRQLLRVTNTGAIVDQTTLAAFLSDTAAQTQQIDALLNKAVDGAYAGVNLDYQGVTAGQTQAFTTFVSNLAAALHGRSLTLAVTLNAPAPAAGAGWDSAGQDWPAIGRVADVVYLQMPLAPAAYDDNGRAEKVIQWATRQVDRNKLAILLSVNAVDALGEVFVELGNEQALGNFGQIDFITGATEIEPETAVEVALSGTAGSLEWETASLSYRYSYEQNGQTRHVWLGNEAAFNHRLRFAGRYNLRGVAVRGLGSVDDGAGYAAAVQNYLGTAAAPQPSSAAIVWNVTDEAGGVIASSSGDALAFTWQAPAQPGRYLINAGFAQGASTASLGSVPVVVLAPPEPEAEATAEPEAEPVAAVTPTPAPATNQPAPAPVNPGTSDAVANTVANIRNGPDLVYGIVGSLQTGERVSLIGRNQNASWLQINTSGDKQGWVFATLLTVNSSVNVNALAVVPVDPPAGGGGGAPPPVIPPSAGGSFALGGQTHSLGNPTLMSQAGMTWVKFQHKWGPGDDPAGLAGRISQAHGNGFKVLLSIPGSPYPSSIDFAGYVNFLGGVAALGPDAIEIWNEQNIDFEWPAGQINATTYVTQMLAPAYNRIKSVNRNVMVISGAPAPTGFFGGGCSANGCDDSAYLAGMAAAGAVNYMDCVGVHYNEGIISPNQASGDPRGGHYTRYFWGMVNTYYNAFGGARPLCFTEIGYLSGQDFGGVPARFGWAGNTTVAQHAQWLAEAVSLSANSGKVRLVIIFNVDFTQYGDDPQAGYAMIRPDGSCPSCALLRQVMGR
jgi:spore germination protein YaaH/uncharacterized protein YgiM (DUF1202 family)